MLERTGIIGSQFSDWPLIFHAQYLFRSDSLSHLRVCTNSEFTISELVQVQMNPHTEKAITYIRIENTFHQWLAVHTEPLTDSLRH